MTLTFDLEIKWGLCGCQVTCSCKISSSWVQQFISYRVHKLFCPTSQWWKIRKSSPVILTFDLWFSKSNRVCAVVKIHVLFVQNFIELSAAFNELSCVQRKELRRKHYSPSILRGSNGDDNDGAATASLHLALKKNQRPSDSSKAGSDRKSQTIRDNIKEKKKTDHWKQLSCSWRKPCVQRTLTS